MNPNDVTEDPQAEEAEDEVLQLGPGGERYLADVRWVNRHHWLGTFAAYAGEWIGVFNQEVVGHHVDLGQLEIDVARERGIAASQLVTTFVPDSKGTGVGAHVARLNLTTRPAFGVRYQHPSDRPGTTTVIPVYHLYLSVCVAPRGSSSNWRPVLGEDDAGEHSRQFEAVLDTGAPLTVIPYRVWRRFAADVDILAQPSSDSRFEIGGGSHNGQFGRLRLGATDDAGHWMAAEWTVALFLDESTAATSLQVPLIGLNAHFFTHRRRVRHTGDSEGDDQATVPEWCLEDKSRLLPW